MSFFACCFRRRNRRSESSHMLREPPEISWENTLGAPNGVPFDEATKDLLRGCLDVKMPTPTTLTEIIKRSEGFPAAFPVSSVRCCALRDRGIGMDTLELNANSVYPLIHEASLPLIAGWLKYKRVYGSAQERTLYRDMNLTQFVQRLLDKRALQFYGTDDRYSLLNGKSGSGGWENVGTEREKEPLVLASCLSYDEMKLSATIIVSSHTEFINDGSRENRGVVCDDPDSIQPRGVIMGVVGTRFEKSRVMEYQDILITHLQNNMDNGYGPDVEGTSEEKRGLRCVWARFYGDDYHPLYDEAMRRVKSKDNKRYVPLTGQIIFDAENYMKRTLMSVEMILLEANTRAEKQNTTAFLHVVGFGLGVWKIIHDQEIYFLKTFEIAIRKMNKKLKYVSDIMFSYFRQQKCGGAGNGDYLGDIRIHFALREPQTKLFRSSDANKLLVVTYAADGNAYPGNEFWGNYLTASGEPAAACSTQIAELHNPRINPRVCGASLHVASPEHGIVHGSISPLGSDQQARRPSRSPRNQRSRSADVDLLKKYTMERCRAVEQRRHTESEMTSRWIPLGRGSLARPSLPTKDHSTGYQPLTNQTQPRSCSVDSSAANVEAHIYYNPAAERSPRRRPSDDRYPPPPGKVKWLPVLTRYKSAEQSDDDQQRTTVPSRQGRSHSYDVNIFRRDSLSRWNERYVALPSEPSRLVSYKWMPETGISMSRYIPSPIARRTSDQTDRPKLIPPTSTRWMTYAKNPSPSPIQRKLSDRRPSGSDQTEGEKQGESSRQEVQWSRKEEMEKIEEIVDWQPQGKHETTINGQPKPSQGKQEESVPDVNRVKQRLRELYDIKTETEWPKRVRNPSRETLWMSKSSSEDDKSQQSQASLITQKSIEPRPSSSRRNSQDLEFNDRTPSKPTSPSPAAPARRGSRKLPERPTLRRESSSMSDHVFEPINVDDVSLRRFQEHLRRTEDLARYEDATEVSFAKMSRVRERRTYSDDYENPCRRKLSDSMTVLREKKRNSDSSFRSSNRPSYAEIETISRSSRTASDASYVSVSSASFYNPQLGKRGSIEFKSTSKRIEMPCRRTMSQYEPRQRTTSLQYENRPRTPVPPPEIEDLYKDFRGAGKSNGFATRQRRNSTRYKVYLT